MIPIVPGVEISVFFIVFLGLAIGVISGFVGVGGGFIMTPALIILGVPAHYAVGTSILWVMGNSLVGTIRHRQEGNVDLKLAFTTVVFVIVGVEIGVRLLNLAQSRGMAEEVVLYLSVIILLLVGTYMFWESRPGKNKPHIIDIPVNQTRLSRYITSIKVFPVVTFPHSGIKVSLIVLVLIGIITGILSGFIGVGGGFLMVPSFIYLLGVPSYIAVGTDLLQIIFSSAYGSFRHIISGNVLIYISVLTLLGSSLGVQFGALATRYIKGVSMRFVLANTILVAVLGSALKIADVLLQDTGDWLRIATYIVTFGGLGSVLVLITVLFVRGVRRQRAGYPEGLTKT